MPTQLSYLGSGAPSRQILGVVAPEARAKNLPDRLRIPKIRVDTAVQQVGLTLDGAMDIPTNSVDVGWFKEGAAPGESGSAVVDGHLDSRDGSPGVFVNLRDLRIGDKVYVRNKSGLETTFVVWQTKTYEPDAQPAEVFNVSDGVHLNLITCTGTWNFGKQNYGQRLVVFTTIEKKAVN